MTPIPKLLQFERIAVPKIWGGTKLLHWLGVEPPKGASIGETWEIYERDSKCSSMVRTGPLAGKSLSDLMLLDGPGLLGNAHRDPFGRFPLVLKFIDASQDLSLQVHPDDEAARQMALSDSGKSEAWVVLLSEPDAELLCGFSRSATPGHLLSVLRAGGDVRPLLGSLSVEPGDVVAVPAGTLHCIGKGLVLYEIQQNSDVTFRLTDWGRLGDDGLPRPVHLEEAEQVLRATSAGATAVPVREDEVTELLVESSIFKLRRLTLSGARSVRTGGFCHLLTLLRGRAGVGAKDERVELRRGETCLVTGRVEEISLTPVNSPEGVTALWVRPVA